MPTTSRLRSTSRASTVVDTSSPSPVAGTSAAFFDVDNTMVMGSSVFHFARGMAARKFLTSRDLANFAWQQLKFRIIGREANGDVIHVIREAALSVVAGKSVDEITRHAEEIYDETIADRVWSGTRMLAQKHLDAGQPVWLVTSAPVELATVIAHRLGLTGALGTVAEVHNGHYTGRLVGDILKGPAKAEAVQSLAQRQGFDLAHCTAYSDSINDLPLLQLVGRAVAVNPDSHLKSEARHKGWEIQDFRTGRKAAAIGIPASLGAGVVACTIFSVLSHHRRSRTVSYSE